MFKLDGSIFLNRKFLLFWSCCAFLSASVHTFYISHFIYDTHKLSADSIEDVATVVSGPHYNWEIKYYSKFYGPQGKRVNRGLPARKRGLHGYKVHFQGRDYSRYSPDANLHVGEKYAVVVDPNHSGRFLFGRSGFSAAELQRSNSEFVGWPAWLFGPILEILVSFAIAIILLLLKPRSMTSEVNK